MFSSFQCHYRNPSQTLNFEIQAHTVAVPVYGVPDLLVPWVYDFWYSCGYQEKEFKRGHHLSLFLLGTWVGFWCVIFSIKCIFF